MKKVCEYQGYYIDYDEETGDEDVLKCKLFTNEGDWEEYCYCDEEERNNCMLYKYSKYIEDKDKELERLNTKIKNIEIINEEHQILNGMLRKQLQQKENIIKEVREKIENTTINCDGVAEDLIDDIYEILDKENDIYEQ